MMSFPGRLACLLATMVGFSAAQAAEVVIDDFTTAQSVTGVVDGTGILGGERDASVQGSNLLNISAGSAVMSLPLDQAGEFIILEWDGNDGSTNVGYGLGEVDITNSASNDRIYLGVAAVSGAIDVTIRIYETPSLLLEVNLLIDETGLIQIPFDDFLVSTPAPDLTSINRIILRAIMNPGESITINKFTAGSVLLFEDGFESN